MPKALSLCMQLMHEVTVPSTQVRGTISANAESFRRFLHSKILLK